jgi:hypothetical protein
MLPVQMLKYSCLRSSIQESSKIVVLFVGRRRTGRRSRRRENAGGYGKGISTLARPPGVAASTAAAILWKYSPPNGQLPSTAIALRGLGGGLQRQTVTATAQTGSLRHARSGSAWGYSGPAPASGGASPRAHPRCGCWERIHSPRPSSESCRA